MKYHSYRVEIISIADIKFISDNKKSLKLKCLSKSMGIKGMNNKILDQSQMQHYYVKLIY